MLMSPRSSVLDPTAWFATTLENTSEYTLETERISINRQHLTEAEEDMRPDAAGGSRRRSSTELMMRSDDASRREVLSRDAARVARSTSSGVAIAKAVTFDDGPAEERRRRRSNTPPETPKTSFGCWPFGRKLKRVEPGESYRQR